MNKNMSKMPLEFLLSTAKASPESPAIRMNGIDMSYGNLLLSVNRRADFFRTNGVLPGSKVAIYTDDDLEMTYSIFALWAVGAVCIPMNITQTADKLEEIEDVISPDLGFYSSECCPGGSRNFPMIVFTSEGNAVREFYHSKDDDLAMIMFTSGTSGIPKAVPMTHFAIGHNAWETSRRINIRPDDRLLINTPPYTTSSIIHMLTMLARGASIVSERGFLFGTGLIDQIREFKCTGFGGVPVHFSRLLATVEGGEPPESLRFLMNSGEHLPVKVLEKIRSVMPSVQIYCVYGLTEVAGRLCILDPELLDEKMGSVGLPLEGMKVTVRDEKGRLLAPNEEGEVCVQGFNLMKGYINAPEINLKVMKPYGFATGDFGYLDEDGCLFLRGRHDDIFKVGGEKVSINVIEEAIIGFDGIEEFAVAPIFDKHIGNIPCLYYVLKEGKMFHEERVIKHLRKLLPSNHIPLYFIELTEIPRTSSGKPMRSKLKSCKD